MSGFFGRVSVITGAGSGIGQALALELARRGSDLALCDVNEEGLRETARRIGTEPRVPVAAQVVPGLARGLRDVDPAVQRAAESALHTLDISSAWAALDAWRAERS